MAEINKVDPNRRLICEDHSQSLAEGEAQAGSGHGGVSGTSGTHRLRSWFTVEISLLLVSSSHVGKHTENCVTYLVGLQCQSVNISCLTDRTEGTGGN